MLKTGYQRKNRRWHRGRGKYGKNKNMRLKLQDLKRAAERQLTRSVRGAMRMDRPVFGVKSENRAVFYVRFADGACADKKENIKK